ncbi:unnamed protein product [Acanthosepion pharaonis]|uniref:Uncharacterized protein n=1 Tax=Acanthosepion pharaonis TaxID=158019 RepID=A0A812DZ95_ACAPH|nr:unnamed protein product [Sepia pharaonis]
MYNCPSSNTFLISFFLYLQRLPFYILPPLSLLSHLSSPFFPFLSSSFSTFFLSFSIHYFLPFLFLFLQRPLLNHSPSPFPNPPPTTTLPHFSLLSPSLKVPLSVFNRLSRLNLLFLFAFFLPLTAPLSSTFLSSSNSSFSFNSSYYYSNSSYTSITY